MPKRLAMVLTLLFTLGVGSMLGETETITAGNGVYSGSGDAAIHTWTLTSCTVTQAKGTGTAVNKSYPNRWYQNNKITFTPKSGYTITQIVLVGTSGYTGQTMSASTGTVSTNTSNYTTTWTGSITSSSSVTLTPGKQFRFGSVTITYSAAPSYTITAQSNNTSYGTVLLSGTTITASPKTGYRVSTTNPYSISPLGSATVKQNGNTFTVTPSAKTTITINFEAIPTHKVYFNTGGLVDIESVDVQEGQTYNITQTPASSLTQECEYNIFVGWIKSNTIANSSSKPTIVNSIEMESSDITLYAVYSKTEGGGGSAAEQGTTMFSENWEGCTNNTQPTQPTSKGSVVYNAATITYEWKSSGSTSQTYTSGGPNSNENILISKNNGYWKVVGIPTGQAETLTLSSSKSGSGVLSVSTSTSNVSISGSTITIGSSSVNTFDLIFTNTNSGSNLRLDDISVVVAKAGATGSTTYSLTPECTTETTVTLEPNGGSVTPTSVTTDGGSLTLPTPTRSNWTFLYWTENQDGTGKQFSAGIYNNWEPEITTLYAQWQCTPPTSVTVKPTNTNGWRCSIGGTISLTATATGGSGNYTYKWQKYIGDIWTDIAGATSQTYTKANCTSGDGGSYRCVVSTGNDCSSMESEGYFVRVFTLNGNYYGEDWTENTIIWSSKNEGTATIHLEASRTYLFKVTDNDGKWFGYGDATNYIVQPWQADCGTSTGNGENADIRLFTGPEGDYTFTINIEHAQDGDPYVNIAVTYPEVEHPVVGYGYIPKWWENCYIHWWDNSDQALTAWGSDAQIKTYTTICESDYYYFPILDIYTNLIIKDAAGDAGNSTGNQTQNNHSGWYISHNGTSWNWYEFAEYTITFDANGGTGTMTSIEEICPNGERVLTNNTYSKTGYTFAGWKANIALKVNGSTVAAGTLIANGATIQNISSNITLTAQWTPKKITITWDANGGSVDPTTSTYTYDGAVVELPTPTRASYIFDGWFTAASSGTKITEVGTTNKPTADVTYYAHWTAKATPTFAWSVASCTAALEADNTFPTLNNPNGLSVTYESSDTDVATIDANGRISCRAEGKTIISATGAESATHKSATATYELTVVKSNCKWVETDIANINSGDEVVITMTKGNYVWTISNEKHTSSTAPTTVDISANVEGQYLTTVNEGNKWVIEKNNDNLTFYSYSDNANYLYCINQDNGVRVGTGTAKVFVIDGNYLKNIETTSHRYLGVSLNTNPYTWRCCTVTTGVISDQTLKFYKKTCLPANKFWIDYELANVTCTTDPTPSQIDQTGEDLLLEFSANDGYKLPEQVSITMGGNTLSEEAFDWDAEEGVLYIVPEDGITGDIVITVEGCELLAIPTNLKANNITSSSATLSWDEIDHATEYQIHITDDDDSTEDIITTTSNTYYEVTGLSSACEYLWGVTPIASGYCGLTQEAEIFTTLDVHTVTFNTDGGTDVAPQTVDHGGKATKPANPTKTGYTFAGWYTEADTEFNFNTPIESATILYAKWNANQYTITFRQQWGDEGTETATVHFNNNNFSVSPIIVPTRNGYTFGGYYTAESGAGTQLIDVSGAWLNTPTYIEGGKWVYADNLTLYAKWTQNFTITWMANGQPYHSQTAMMGTAIAKPDDPDEFACNDKVFVGWLDKTISGSTNEEPTFVTDFGTIQAAETYHAVFATLTGTPSNDYNKITDINDLTDGEYVITYSYDGGTQVVLKNTTKDAKYMNASALAPSSNKYTSPSAEYIWQLQKQDDGSYYMYNSSVNKFLYATTSALQLSDNPTKYSISYDNTYSHWKIKLTNNTSYYMHGYVSGSSYDFRVSTSGSGNKYRVYLYKNASTAVYSDYVTTCIEIPTPHWEGAEIDNANIAVDCGAISFKSNASKITFDKNYDLTYSITLTASEGFLLSTNQQKDDEYKQSVTVTPVQSDEHGNKGKITQSVHVRADATGKNTNFDGTITISGDQLAEDQIIEVHAVVDCPQYTLTFNDCGHTKTISDFAGTSVEEMEPWAETCSEPFQYVFDGWATAPVTNGTEEYDKVDFSAFTMPNNNTTILYAVYRYAEEGGEPVNGYVKVTEALADWSGDYVIVDNENLFAIKNAYRENTSSNKTLAGETVTIENDKVVSPSANIVWSFSKNGNGYTMYNVATDIYAGIGTHSRAAVLSEIIADENNIKIIFDDATDIAKVSGIKNNRCFQYYVTNDEIKEWRTYDSDDSRYNTGYLYRFSEKTIRYTSSLVCGSIEAENAIVTSTVGQTVKVYVPITLGYSGAASITGTSDNEAFTVVTKNDVTVGESNIEVHYKPTAYVNTANQEETATITLTTSNGATTTFNITGRCLPEAFVIAAKWGNNWYALPANMSSETTAEGLLIEVDNPTNPAKAIAAPNTTKYSLKAVYKSNQSADRFAEFGNRLVFVEEVEEATPVANKTLYNGGGDAQNSSRTNIQVYAQYSGYYNSNPDRYEWIPTTTDLKDYILTSAHVFTGEATRTISLDNHGVFGTLLQNKSYNGMVRLLPVESFYTPTELQVVEWKEDGVSIMYTGSGTKATTKVGNNAEGDVQLLSEKKIDHAVYTLSTSDLIAATNQVLTISIQDNDGNIIGIHKMTVPWILNSSKSSGEIASEVTQATDIVVLNGATLTAANTKHTYDDVVVYPGGKLVVGVDGKLGMYSLTLRLGSSWGAAEYEHKYPEFVLNTKADGAYSNTSGKINLDYITTKEQYYTFVAPFEVKTKDIKYPVDIYGSNVEAANRGSFEFQYYDGAARAAGERGWQVVEEDPTNGAILTAHKGYTFYGMPKKVSVNGGTSTRQKFGIHRIPMSIGAAKVMEHENTAQTSAVSAYPSQHNINAGWNLIGNPYMATITGLNNNSIQTGTIVLVDDRWQWSNEGTQANRFIVFPSNDGEWYYTSQASNATLPAFKNFFVQIGDENATALSILRNIPAAQAPARRAAQEAEEDIELAIVLEQDAAHADQLDFLVNDAYTAVYDYNADFTKMMNNTQLNLFGLLMEDNLSFVAVDHLTAKTDLAIGYQVPQAGQYTLRLSDKPYVMWSMVDAIYVTDHEVTPEATTNLLDEAYTFQVSNAETNTTRFSISIVPSKESGGTTTAIDDILHQDMQTQKFIYNDQLYILRGGVVYDAMGQRVTTINQ